MSDKVFIDTNILVYSMDLHEPAKRQKARALLREVRDHEKGVVSTQVLQELYVAGTRKLGVDPLQMKGIIHSLHHFEIVIVDFDTIKEAMDCQILNQLSFWDALIVVSAERAECERLWTEDMQDGQIIRNVRIEDPFKVAKKR